MSAIREEQIGFGGNDSHPTNPSSNVIKQKIASELPITSDDVNSLVNSLVNEFGSIADDKAKQDKFAKDHPYDTTEAWFPTNKSDPFKVNMSPPKYTTDMTPTLESLKQTREQKIPEVNIEVKTQPDGSFNIKSDLDAVNRNNPNYKSMKPNQQSIDESKKIMKNFQKGVANYPKYMSYEGSMVICVMLSMKSPALVQMDCLPSVDQETINGTIKGLGLATTSYFYVEFDENKDFIVSFKQTQDSKDINVFNMFNTVAHPRNDDLKDTGVGEVPVENDGDTIKVGNKIVVDKRVMRTIMKMPSKDTPITNETEEEFIPKRQPVTNKNAYELRCDIMQMATDFGLQNKIVNEDKIVEIARKFYSFVENRR